VAKPLGRFASDPVEHGSGKLTSAEPCRLRRRIRRVSDDVSGAHADARTLLTPQFPLLKV
jgi:hypothetical protein